MAPRAAPSSSRGAQDVPVATPSYPDRARREVVTFIKKAITEGDMLPNALDMKPARRRALIIAPQYRELGRPDDLGPLPSTAADAKLVYELLVRSDYDRQNIRILCDACYSHGRADPTRENILDSLEWLVAGAAEGDFRFLHFSGHGERLQTDSSRGKQGRTMDTSNWLRIPGAWDTELMPSTIGGQRVAEQIIGESELVYYNEAIVTRLGEKRELDLDPESDEEPDSGRVWDRELNEYLSRLPEGCTITCIMDCCASGRILNLSRKLRGSGFRGKPTQVMTNIQPLFIPSLPSFNPSADAPMPSPGLISPSISSIAAVASTMVSKLPHLVRYARIAMQEGIPEQERDMDGIRARIFAWSACHQRQRSFDSNDFQYGLLTQTFTETCIRLGVPGESPIQYTYNTLFEEVSKLVADQRATVSSPEPQFVQLWTSLKKDDRKIETGLLDSYVEF